VDDADFATKVGKKKRNCEWIGTLKKSKRTKQCQKKKAGFLKGCPLSCGACTATDGDAAVATCGKTYAEVSRARDEVLQDRYLSVGGKPLPNFEAPVVAYAHYTHCKGVVDAGKPEKATPMDTMHFEHCSVALEKIRSQLPAGETMDAAACSAAFPHLEIAASLDALGMGSSGMNEKLAAEYSYGFNYLFFDYGFTYSSADAAAELAATPRRMEVDAIVADNFADVLMRQSSKEATMTEGEQRFLKIMDGRIAGALNRKALLCQK
jgi:hypothetical protein